MLICKTPFRVSLFGGGTDLPKWFKKNKGMTVSFTIDKYCYLSLRRLPNLFPFKYRLRYFKDEIRSRLNDIKHPSIKAILKNFHISDHGLELVHSSDIPGLSGLGSSSAFTVSLINLIFIYKNIKLNKCQLAKKSIFIEHDILKESVGFQDQYACAYGGFNSINYSSDKISVKKIKISRNRLNNLTNNCLLVYSGIQRKSQIIERDKIKNLNKENKYLEKIHNISIEGKKILESNSNQYIQIIAELLNETWVNKKNLSQMVTNTKIEKLYNFGIENGAIGGKLLGAGGGGYILFLSKNTSEQKKLIRKLGKKVFFKFKIDDDGSQIIYS